MITLMISKEYAWQFARDQIEQNILVSYISQTPTHVRYGIDNKPMACATKSSIIKDTSYHFKLQDELIVCWNGNDGWTTIAKVIEKRQCIKLLRNSNFQEDVESLMDTYIFEDTLTHGNL